MTNTERFDVALTRVRGGETIRTVVSQVYTNWRRYKRDATEHQRKQIKSARMQYLALGTQNQKPERCRMIFDTHSDRKRAILLYCKANNIKSSTFINAALFEAMQRAGIKVKVH